jgi:hypothetical protein
MIGMDSNHCQIVEQSLNGQRAADEETYSSLAVLSERLERVRKLGPAFGKIDFSPAVKGLAQSKNTVAVC